MFRSLFILVGGFVLGVFLRSLFSFEILLFLFGSVSFFLFFTLFYFVFSFKKLFFLYFCLFFFSFLCGFLRTEYAFSFYEKSQFLEEGILLENVYAYIYREPDVREEKQIIYARIFDEKFSKSFTIRFSLSRHIFLEYGDVVSLNGTLEKAEPFLGDNNRMFFYDSFLMKENVQYILKNASLKKKENEKEGNIFLHFLFSIKNRWLSSISSLLPEPSSSLAGGIIVGAKQSLGEELLKKFQDTGLIHIVVLSGYNLTLVAIFIHLLFRRTSKRSAFIGSIVGIIAFASMVGFSATVVRASIMAIISIIALYIGNVHETVRALFIAGFLMLLWNPFLLVFDVGFQLSFVATLGIIFGVPIVSHFLSFITDAFEIRTLLSATLVTQIFITPLLAYHIGSVSLVSPFVNLFTLPIIPLAMLFGFLSGIVGLFLPLPFGLFMGYLSHLLLSYIIFVVEVFHTFPFRSIEIPPTPFFFVCVFYVLLSFFVYKKRSLFKK
jgi:competence protein ComEC